MFTPDSGSSATGVRKLQSSYPMSCDGSDCVVVIPALNEEECILGSVDSLLRQTAADFEIVVADGGSTDRTRALVATAMERRTAPPSCRKPRPLAVACGEFGGAAGRLKREMADPGGCAHNLSAKFCGSAARRRATDRCKFRRRANARYWRKPFSEGCGRRPEQPPGNGGSLHRLGSGSQFVDHGHHALFELGHFRRVGGYDEAFSHNEDFELDHRIRGAGGTIWLTAHAPVDYIPRRSPTPARQYFLHGQGRARTVTRRLYPKDQASSARCGARLLCRRGRRVSLDTRGPVLAFRASRDLSRVGRDARIPRTRLMRGRQRYLCSDHAHLLGVQVSAPAC